jgi:hypothetical protein
MDKYIIASCFKKMYRRAFHWSSYNMIRRLIEIRWPMSIFPPVHIKADGRLSSFLGTIIDNNSETFGSWVMTYHPSKSVDLHFLDEFLTLTLGPSDYQFDNKIAAIFHDLLLSSLYAYLCFALLLKHFKKARNQKEEEIQGFVGFFSNAIRVLYLVLHSNVMRAYFANVPIHLPHPTPKNLLYDKFQVDHFIRKKLEILNFEEKKISAIMEDKDKDKDKDEDKDEDEDKEDYVEHFKDKDGRLVYRRSLMSFVDHFAGLRLLERRSLVLPADETIKLSLIAVRKAGYYYSPWEEMKKVIDKTCKDFAPPNTPNPIDGQDMINKIKEHLQKSSDDVPVIKSFKTLLTIFDTQSRGLEKTKYPVFRACIHCESSLAAILLELHLDDSLNHDDDLQEHFRDRASPSSPSSSFTP